MLNENRFLGTFRGHNTRTKIDKFKNNKNAYHENIDFYNMTHLRHCPFDSSMRKNGRLKFILPAK
jgi:hypothetical protein